ncbi:MAG: LPS export ABC transporter periplasmic protein LptC [Bacteroidales bacterium]
MGIARNILFIVAAIIFFIGCKNEKGVEVAYIETDSLATIITRDIKTLISDSGITQYRLTAAEWQMYENTEPPIWIFPDGLYIEKFDSLFQVVAYIKADSAVYHKDKKLWELNHNVAIQNIEQETMLTQQLFWDQNAKELYSDSFIHITRKDRIIEGYGFRSNESFSSYRLLEPSGIFPVEEKQKRVSDTTNIAINDSIQNLESK